ncbi:MAG: 3-dehydroquinate synthase [Eubacterium sp.]|nr:3-dehydroquinate synthase [Eubacterium sp.]
MIQALKNLTNRIPVQYENKHCYDILLEDSFQNLPKEMRQFQIENKKLCIVTETNVGPLYAEELAKILEPLCKKVVIHTFEAGEQHKNLKTVEGIYQTLIENKFDRNDMLVALGGGVVGDTTGFVAATYLRGIDFIQVPTTLLSQVDSSIGGKTGVDLNAYKNMVGAFYMPKLVYMNINTLMSLPKREYLSGMGEIIKHGLIKDQEYFHWLNEHYEKIVSRDFDTLKEMLFVSCNIKRQVVENDPKEKGERALLNFGHTIGHAVEKLKNFTLLHGECVALGMCAAAYLTWKASNIKEDEYQLIIDTIQKFELPTTTIQVDAKEVVEATLNDKKMDSGSIKFILLDSIGEAFITKELTQEHLLEATKTIIEE